MKRFGWLIGLLLLAASAGAEDLELGVVAMDRAVSLDPFDGAWAGAKGIELALMAQTIAPPGGGGAVKKVRVKALQSRQDVFFRLDWADGRADAYPSKAESFSDAVALQFPAEPQTIPSPFMGDKEGAVVIWRWSASAQKDFDKGYQPMTAGFPRAYAEIYPYDENPTFRSGEKAGNILSQRRRASPVESLYARGFGTLTSAEDQTVQGRGVWRNGRWHVVFKHSLTGNPSFLSGSRLVFALAAWDGGARERNGMKSVSVWQGLAMPGAPARPAEDARAKGHRVYRRYGCAACHGQDGLGGVRNPNAQGDLIPPLNRVKEGFSKTELLAVILKGREPARADPTGPPARFKMNAWGSIMGPLEADSLVEYLLGLMPQDKGQDW
jgi:mono/diheme cytochrome c family protein